MTEQINDYEVPFLTRLNRISGLRFSGPPESLRTLDYLLGELTELQQISENAGRVEDDPRLSDLRNLSGPEVSAARQRAGLSRSTLVRRQLEILEGYAANGVLDHLLSISGVELVPPAVEASSKDT